MAANDPAKTSFTSTSRASTLSALSSETPENESKCQASSMDISPDLLKLHSKVSAAKDSRKRTIMFLGHEGSGKSMAVEAMAKYLTEQRGYEHPSITSKLFKLDLGFSLAVDVLHFEEGLTMIHFPDKWEEMRAMFEAVQSDHIAKFKKLFSRKFQCIDAIFLVLKVTKNAKTMEQKRNQMLMSVLDLFDGQDVADNTFLLLTTQEKGAQMKNDDLRRTVRTLCRTDDCDGISYIVDAFEFDATAVPIKSSLYWFPHESGADEDDDIVTSATDTSTLASTNALVFRDIFYRLRVLIPARTSRGHASRKVKGRRSLIERSLSLKVLNSKIRDAEAKDDE